MQSTKKGLKKKEFAPLSTFAFKCSFYFPFSRLYKNTKIMTLAQEAQKRHSTRDGASFWQRTQLNGFQNVYIQ
jgi:hypothetical protein